MWPWFERVLDILAPRKERVVRLAGYAVSDLRPDPRIMRFGELDVTTLAAYRTPAVDDCIRALKYDHASRAAPLLGAMLREHLHEELASQKRLSSHRRVLIPVPLHPKREQERGFNQIECVLRTLPAEFSDGTLAEIDTSSLVRVRATAQQTRLSRAERLSNVRDAFALMNAKRLENAHVYLIDDVVTTGATLSAAAQPLIEAGIQVELVALARA